ncbi:MAG: hypothetical protein HY290_08075 [Planctomycetia bacterium]|nr:hypothetical protein [Planctomycetia bacterium]
MPVILLLALVNFRAHRPGDAETVVSQLQFLGDSLHEGSGERMQSSFPEGYVFTWALYGLASAQVARQLPQNDPRWAELLDRVRDAVDHVDSPIARSTFPKELDPPYGAFYCAWSLYLRAEYMRAAGADELTPTFVQKFEEDCTEFAHVLRRSQTPFLPSYPAAAWPVDTCVAIAALSIRDRILGPKYESVIKRWVADARSRLDPRFNALSHAADARTGAPHAVDNVAKRPRVQRGAAQKGADSLCRSLEPDFD